MCDKDYLRFLYTLMRIYLGENVVIFTTDGAGTNLVECGSLLPYAYPTVDFGPGANLLLYFLLFLYFVAAYSFYTNTISFHNLPESL